MNRVASKPQSHGKAYRRQRLLCGKGCILLRQQYVAEAEVLQRNGVLGGSFLVATNRRQSLTKLTCCPYQNQSSVSLKAEMPFSTGLILKTWMAQGAWPILLTTAIYYGLASGYR